MNLRTTFRPQNLQVGPEYRCSQFEHHAWLFCRETKWKSNSSTGAKPASARDSLKPWLSPDHFQHVKPHPPRSTCVRTNQRHVQMLPTPTYHDLFIRTSTHYWYKQAKGGFLFVSFSLMEQLYAEASVHGSDDC